MAEALGTVEKTGGRYYQAELYRLKGELTLAHSSVQTPGSKVKEAEKCFLKAINAEDLARARIEVTV